jgi:hypothetical protein
MRMWVPTHRGCIEALAIERASTVWANLNHRATSRHYIISMYLVLMQLTAGLAALGYCPSRSAALD